MDMALFFRNPNNASTKPSAERMVTRGEHIQGKGGRVGLE
jgi:hypothetical protein